MKSNTERFVRWLLPFAASSLLLSGCALFPKEEAVLAPPLVEPAPVSYEVAKVERETIAKSIKGSSTFTSPIKHELYFRDPTEPLQSFDVKVGDHVKKGQVVATLDAGDIELDIQTAEFELKKAQLELKAAQMNDPYTLEGAKLELARAELYAKVDETKLAALDVAKAKLRVAELQDTEKKRYEIDVAQMNVSEKQMRLQTLKKKYEDTRLVSPIAGEVTFVSNEAVGDKPEALQPLVTVADPTKLFVLYKAPDVEYLKEIGVGMRVSLTLKDNTKLDGRVVQAPNGIPADLTEAQFKEHGDSLVIAADKLSEKVEMGTPVDLEIKLSEHVGVLTIPIKALHEFDGRHFVQVLDGKSKREIDVETGIQNALKVEIVKGLQEGQTVIME
ncbi:efflux RND transporter periplasmic adaptor subunit [Brevibacillus fluminis]|nr:HlyD family efflux transporter periplasmic adaptor subunit [Brevibacillus fluminis]